MFSCLCWAQNTEELLSACFRQLWTRPHHTDRVPPCIPQKALSWFTVGRALPGEDSRHQEDSVYLGGLAVSTWEDSLYPGGLALPGKTRYLYLGGLTLPERTHSIWEDSLSTQEDSVYLG